MTDKEKTAINAENYFDRDNAIAYMSNSQFGMFMTCPAKAIAVINGDFEYARSEDMLAGSFADVALTQPHKLDAFKDDNPEMFSFDEYLSWDIQARFDPVDYTDKQMQVINFLSAAKDPVKRSGITEACGVSTSVINAAIKKGSIKVDKVARLKSKFVDTLAAITKVSNTPEALSMLRSPDVKNQVVLTGEIGGVPFRGLVDAIDVKAGIITDLKCMANLTETKWNGTAHVPWYVAWNYWRQGTIYRELAKQMHGKEFSFRLLAVSKQTPPDLRCFEMKGKGAYNAEMDKLLHYLPEFMKYKSGEIEPFMCKACDYCRGVKPFETETAEYE